MCPEPSGSAVDLRVLRDMAAVGWLRESWPMSMGGRCAVPPALEPIPSRPAGPLVSPATALGLQQLAAARRSSPEPQPSALPDAFWSETLSYYQTLLASRVAAGTDQERAETPPDDEPLDLSCSRASPTPTVSRPARRAEPPPPTKKPYTEEELQAALRDIQSGRLGTRRAAVIYGIPRSTLRNKVYRLNAQEKRAEQLAEAKRTPPPPPPPPPAAAAEPAVNAEIEIEEVEAPKVCEPAVSVCSEMPPSQLLQARLTRPAEPLEPVRAAVMGWMYSGVLQRALQARDPAATRADQPPVLDDFVRRMSHERFHEVLAQLRAAGAVSAAAEEAAQPPPPLLPVTVAAAAEQSDSRGSDDTDMTSTAGSRKRKLDEDNNNMVSSPAPPAKGSKAAKAAAKGSRPKRGKYRNYNRSHLADAVRAVQSGEMSVHRAGNFYGVPHSTLEYKVKQRHLDRAGRRERAAERPPSASSPVPADRVATSGGVMTYRSGSPPAAGGPLLSSDVLRQLQEGQRRPGSDGDADSPGLLDKGTFARLLGGGLSISGITNRAHTAGGQVLQTTESS
ncbi:Mushroom body large-type Kenyon cell-specific protein 1 [Amphibalanus amphitrite]|uniref:Mushroom body large-type Kenyon cell-specific protein 1 n=1 Tax=Amphibalanus amphitrite TaxID=1232801 RepID=A0A6A4V167_AMPAM|nr:Mushroom body large-type Kenyon cell-specific protein 1 [Amphibalanus amphitrite]